MKMKAVVLEGANQFGPKMIDRPIIGDDEILLKMVKAERGAGFTKNYREMPEGEFVRELTEAMERCLSAAGMARTARRAPAGRQTQRRKAGRSSFIRRRARWRAVTRRISRRESCVSRKIVRLSVGGAAAEMAFEGRLSKWAAGGRRIKSGW